jgi:hypothetical protein
VPLSDQILLLGPPYKVPKDATIQSDEVLNALRLGDVEDDPIQEESQPARILSSTERSGARRLFLFSKQLLSEHSPDPPECRLEPLDTHIPTEPPGPSPLPKLGPHSSPLHQALAAYERQFMLYLAQARVYADNADLRWTACRTCVQEQAVMARALRAAVSNLSDHYHGATRTRAEFTAHFQTKTSAHANLLHKFESLLTSLATIHLHPSLVSIARASGRAMETLLDTVPVERERAWAQQCMTSHQRLTQLFNELEVGFKEMGAPLSRENESRKDQAAEEQIESLWQEVDGDLREMRDRQAQRVEQLTNDHARAVTMILSAVTSDNEDDVQAALLPLRDMSNTSKALLPLMLEDDTTMRTVMLRVAESKNAAMKRMRDRLREVSKSQSLIQRVLSSVGVLREALNQQCENMSHLEHAAELPASYKDFLSEIRRRRAYGHAVTATCSAMLERLVSIRTDEVKAREKFLRGSGRHLMPAFYDLFAPTLATPPPLFTPQLPAMVELDTLPDIGDRDDDAGDTGAQSMAVTEQGVGSTSTLTTESQVPMASVEHMVGSSMPTNIEQESHQMQDQLIVSADEQSANNLILDPSAGTITEADLKTLAYENAVLRQALERTGTKPPRAYIQEAVGSQSQLTKVTTTTKTELNEMEVLRKELAAAKLEAQAAKDALEVANTVALTKPLSDKISHSSFEVGDVGLFMPTGRGSGGKRTYLAFHTNCPHRYLSTDCIQGAPDFVLGRIVYLEELVAGVMGTDANPYGLHMGTKFWVLTVEMLKP